MTHFTLLRTLGAAALMAAVWASAGAQAPTWRYRAAAGQTPPRHAASALDAAGTTAASGTDDAQAAPVNIRGNVIYSDFLPDQSGLRHPVALYDVEATAQDFRMQAGTEGLSANGGSATVGNVYYAVNSYVLGSGQKVYLQRWDRTSWQRIGPMIELTTDYAASDVAPDPTTGLVYGCFINLDGAYELATVDYAAVSRRPIAVLAQALNALACDAQGQLWAIGGDDGVLYRVDKATGAMTAVGATGYLPYYVSSAAFDPVDGTLYWTVAPRDGSGLLTRVDTTTGAATLVQKFTYNDEITALEIPVHAAAAAPGAVTGLSLDFPQGTLSGNVTFTMPGALYDGTTPEADAPSATWTVAQDGGGTLTGTAAYGQAVQVPVTVARAASYRFTVRASNAQGGDGPEATVEGWLGPDTPLSPTGLRAVHDGQGQVSVTWDAPQQTVHGGWMDPSSLTYRVLRTRGGDTRSVGGAVSVTAVTDALADLPAQGEYELVGYMVQVYASGNYACQSQTEYVGLGAREVPLAEAFDQASSMDSYAAVDANADSRTWAWRNSAAHIDPNRAAAMDDWLMLPALRLRAGEFYTLSFNAQSTASTVAERLEVRIGSDGPTAWGMGAVVLPAVNVSGTVAQPQTATFAVPEDGVYTLGVHAVSEANTYGLTVDDISVAAAGEDATCELPFSESWAGAEPQHQWNMVAESGNATWLVFDDRKIAEAQAVDADGGFLAMEGHQGGVGSITSPWIDLNGAAVPALTFHTFNLKGTVKDTNTIEVSGRTMADADWTPLQTFVIDDACGAEAGWHRLRVILPQQWNQQVAQLKLTVSTLSYVYTMLDALSVADLPDIDLAAMSIKAPQSVPADHPFDVEVTVANLGSTAVPEWRVDLYRNGAVVATAEGPEIEPNATAVVALPHSLCVADDGQNLYHAVVVVQEDSYSQNNTTATVEVALEPSPYPAPASLTATDAGNGTALLSWQAPEMGQAGGVTTDSFEDYDPWATAGGVGEWTLVDGDKAPVGGTAGYVFPGIDDLSQQSWWVMDADDDQLRGNKQFAAHSGTRYMAQQYCYDGLDSYPCDDWLITPALDGAQPQTVTFWARSYSDAVRESFEVLYSATDRATDSFTSLATVTGVPCKVGGSFGWTQYSYELPAGARYFAIRCVSDFCWMLFVDDVTFNAAGAGAYQLQAYNVYRQGVRVATVDPEATSWTDTGIPAGTGHVDYALSAVYGQGESPVAHASVDMASGVEAIGAEATTTDAQVRYYDLTGRRLQAPVEGQIVIVRQGSKALKVKM